MSTLDPAEYFRRKLDSLNAPKQASVAEAMEIKLKGLQEYQQAVSQGRAFLNPDRSALDVVKDVGLVAARGVVALPEALVGLVDIPTGGAFGKDLEELGVRFKDTKDILGAEFSPAQKEANLRVELADGFTETFDQAIQNPSTIAAAIGESLPQMLGGAAAARGLLSIGAKGVAAGAAGPALPGVMTRALGAGAPVVAGAVGEGLLGAGAAAEDIRQGADDGRLTLKQALAAVGTGVGTAGLSLVGGKLAQKLGVTDIDTALASGSLKTPGGFLKAVAAAGLTEGVLEEMPQSAQEQMWKNFAEDKPLTEGVGDAAAMGLLTGLAMGQTVGTAGALSGLAAPSDDAAAPDRATTKAKEQAQVASIASGDVSALVDPKLDTYDPAQAVAALAGHSAQDTTPDEIKSANLVQAGEIVSALEARRDAFQRRYNGSTPEGVAARKAELAQATDPVIVEGLTKAIELAEKETPATLRAMKVRVAQLDESLVKAQENLGRFTEQAAAAAVPKEVNVASLVAEIDAPLDTNDMVAVEKRVKAADTVINLSMATPESLTPQAATSMASNATNGLTEPQRAYLREFSAARQADNRAKDMDGVQKEVLFGGKGYLGLVQHRSRVSSALASGNRTLARNHLAVLEAFQKDHAAKAAIATQAWAQGKGTQIVRGEGNAQWSIHTGKRLTDAQIKANGGLTMNADTLASGIAAESAAITATLKELQAARDLKFPQKSAPTLTPKPTGGTPNVTNVQGALAPTQNAVAGNQEAQAQGAPAEAEAGGATAATDSGAGSSEVGSTGVDLTATVVDNTAAEPESAAESTEVSSEAAVSNETQTPSESPEETSVDSGVEAEEVPAGRLSVFENPEEGNLVATGFTQEQAREGDVTQRPLVAVKNFLDNLVDQAEGFLAERLDDAQRSAVQSFAARAKKWAKRIQANLPGRSAPEFRFEDAMQFLLQDGPNGQSTIDQNVMTAISYAAYSWVAAEATSPAIQDNKAVNKILGLQADDWAGHEAYERLGPAGSYQHLLMDSLGGSVMDALGLRSKPDMPQNMVAKLRATLGAHALKLLEDEGLIKRTSIDANTITRLRGAEPTDADVAYVDKRTGNPVYRQHYFFAVARQEDGQVTDAVHNIYEANQGSKSVLDKLFKVEGRSKVPSLTPVTTLPANTKGTPMQVPAELRAVLLANQSRPRKLRKDIHALLGIFDSDTEALGSLIGVVPEDVEGTHLVNRRGVEAKNDALKREYDQFQEWIGEYLATSPNKLDTPFYYAFSPWKQQRVGIATTVGNPQTSKIARFLVQSPEWTVEVDSTDDRLMTSFFLRVAEGLGMKTERMDNAVMLTKVAETLADPVYVAGIQALQKAALRGQELTAEEKVSIVEAVSKGGENLHSLDALLAVARQQDAKAAVGKDAPYKFTSDMMGEVDGVANGTMLNHILMGAADSVGELQTLLEAGGFYREGSNHTQYNQWRGTPGNRDIYEQTAHRVHEKVGSLFPRGSENARVVSSIWAIAGNIFDTKTSAVTKDGRNLVKDALNPLAFGSSLKSVVRGMSVAFLKNVYSGFEKLSIDKASQKEVDAYVVHLNTLIAGSDAKSIRVGATIEELMSYPLRRNYEAALMDAFADTVGMATKEVVEADFAPFLERRNSFNSTANMAFGLSNAIYEGTREAYIEELAAKGEILLDSKGNRIGDLSKKQEAELQKRLRFVDPVIQTAMSKTGKGKGAGLRMAKIKRKMNNAPEYANNTKFGTPMRNNKKAMVIRGFSSQQSEPGVAMGSASTHSFDSGISHRTQAKRDVLNVHDAVGDGVGGLEESARLMNQNTWEGLLDYSPLAEVYESLATVVRGLEKMLDSGELSPQAAANVQNFLADQADRYESSAYDMIEDAMRWSKEAAYAADKIRLSTLATLASVDQYAFQGGNFLVQEADRAKAAEKLAKLEKDVPAKDAAAVATILTKLYAVGSAPAPTAVAQDTKEEDAEPVVDGDTNDDGEFDLNLDLEPTEVAVTKTSPFGTLGKPSNVDARLVKMFAADPNPSMREVLVQLARSLQAKGDGRTETFQLELVKQIYKSIPASITVKLVTPDTVPADVLEMPKQNSLGWIVSKDGKTEIYILSADFVNSGLQSTETLLHELVHGSVAHIVANPTGDAVALVDELKALMAKVKEQPEAANFPEAMGDVQEFIAYGMTNPAFQRLLSTVTMKTTTSKNALVSGFKEFIDKIVKILFTGSSKSPQARTVNGVTIMVKNVSGLLNAASQDRVRNGPLNLSQAVQRMTTLDIHNALNGDGLSTAFDAKLADLLSSMVNKLHGPFGSFRNDVIQSSSSAATAQDIWLQAVDTGLAPFASSVQASPIAITDKEAHAMEQVEATVRAALDTPDASTRVAYRELYDLFLEMKATISPNDFTTPDEHAFIFDIDANPDGRSHHLARFAAFALAHQEFNGLMTRSTKKDDRRLRDAKTFGERVQIVFEKLLAIFGEKLTKTYSGQPADAKLETLVRQLVNIEAKKRLSIARAAMSTGNVFEKMATSAGETVKAGVLKAANTAMVKDSKNAFVRLGGSLVRLQANDQVEWLLREVGTFRDKHFKGLHGLPTELLNQVKGMGQTLNLLQLMSTNSQRQRKHIITLTAKAAMLAFKDGGEYLRTLGNSKDKGKGAKASISQVFMRTGLHVLVDKFSMMDLEKLLTDRKALDKEIASTEAELRGLEASSKYADQFIHQANALGYFRVTGRVKHPKLMMNAHNIARLYGTTHRGRLTEAESQAAEPIIERLVSLLALSYVNQSEKAMAGEIMKTENARPSGEGNGVEFVLRLSKRLDGEAKDRLFKNQAALAMHGYTSEIYNPGTTVAVANEEDGQELEYQGYTKGKAVKMDPADPVQELRHMYVLRDGGLARFQTGIVSYSGKRSKGSRKHSGYLNTNTEEGLFNSSMNADIAHDKPGGLSSGPRPDLAAEKGRFMAPIVNPQGYIVNWRYLMADNVKDSVLERDNRFETMLGVLAGSIYDKLSTTETNTQAFEAMRDIFQDQQYTQPNAFVLIGPKSSDAKLREIWSMLPEESKTIARKNFGKDGMYVRKDMLLPMFGYRQYSLAEAFRKDPDARNLVEDLFVEGIEFVLAAKTRLGAKINGRPMTVEESRKYAKRAAVRVAQGEKAWQELVHEVKDIIVVKSGIVMLDNIRSNLTQLVLSGVPIRKIIKSHLVALRAARAYETDNEELDLLSMQMATGTVPAGVDAQQKMAKLRDSLTRNPVKELIDAGLMPTIVEDVQADDDGDPFSYKSQLVKKTSGFVDKLNPKVVDTAKVIYMAHDTRLYQGLNRLVRVSDFMGRYTLYQHMMETKQAGPDGKPMTKEAAISEASEAFVNYDSPLPRQLQYLDNMGIVPFTKYYLRIQRVLFRLVRNNPGKVLATLLLNNFVDLGPIVLESSWIARLGNNPLHWGALQLPGTLDDLGTIAAATAIIK